METKCSRDWSNIFSTFPSLLAMSFQYDRWRSLPDDGQRRGAEPYHGNDREFRGESSSTDAVRDRGWSDNGWNDRSNYQVTTPSQMQNDQRIFERGGPMGPAHGRIGDDFSGHRQDHHDVFSAECTGIRRDEDSSWDSFNQRQGERPEILLPEDLGLPGGFTDKQGWKEDALTKARLAREAESANGWGANAIPLGPRRGAAAVEPIAQAAVAKVEEPTKPEKPRSPSPDDENWRDAIYSRARSRSRSVSKSRSPSPAHAPQRGGFQPRGGRGGGRGWRGGK